MKRLFYGMLFAFGLMIFCSTTVSAAESEKGEFPFVVEEDSIYYESSENFGSGKYGVVNEENPYTTKPCCAAINGYSFLDMNGNIITAKYVEEESNIAIPEKPEGTVSTLVHFRCEKSRNGWILQEKVKTKRVVTPEDYAPPKQVVEQIDEILKKDSNTAIVIDYSSSMSDDQQKVVNLLSTLEFNDETTIIVFANKFEIINLKQLASNDFYVGGGTDMFPALNHIKELNDIKQLILITDLETKTFPTKLEENKMLESVKIYDPDDSESDESIMNEMILKFSNAKISRTEIVE